MRLFDQVDFGSEFVCRAYLRSAVFKKPLAVSLTPRGVIFCDEGAIRLNENLLRSAVQHLFGRLKRRLFGHKRSDTWTRLVVYEQDPNLHVHCMIDLPEHVDLSEFREMVVSEWKAMNWGTESVDLQLCDEGWLVYITKSRSKAKPLSECWDRGNSVFSYDEAKFNRLIARRRT